LVVSMTCDNLENLAVIGQLKVESFSESEFEGLLKSGMARLDDAKKMDLNLESRFDLAYNSSHALSLAALRWHGYRSENRYMVFQCLQHTLDMQNEMWRILDQAHRKRNLAEYEGYLDVDEHLVEAVIRVANVIVDRIGNFVD
jgi:uncharacterized protein (UPF0332 family)